MTSRLQIRLNRLRPPKPNFREYDAAARRNDYRAHLVQLDGKAGAALDFFARNKGNRWRLELVAKARTQLRGDTEAQWLADQETIKSYERGWNGKYGKRAWPYTAFRRCNSVPAVVAEFQRKASKFKAKWEARLAASQ